MMRRILAILPFLAIQPAAASDEPLVIAAGEHGDYSRVVFKMKSDDVRLEQSGRRILVHNIDQRDAYALSDINDRHKAYRISSARIVQTDDGKALELNLNCDCAGALLTINGKYLIDIRNTGQRVASQPVTAPTAAAMTTSPRVKPAASDGDGVPSGETALTSKDRLSIEQAHKQMVALLERAADEGLVKIRGASDDNAGVTQAPKTAETASPDDHRETDAKSHETPQQPNAVDLAALGTQEDESALKCLPDAALALEDQDLGANPLAKIADLQLQLAEATRNQAQPLARKLAALYLSIGFGEEALALLADNNLENSAYADIARVISERDPRENSALAYAENCDGAHALWQMAAVDPADFPSHYRRTNGAVKRLPDQLKGLIASRLAVKAVTHEAWPEAQELLAVAKEVSPKPTPEIQFVEAMLNKQEGALSAARNKLRNVASTNSATTDDAVMALADSYMEDGAEPYAGLTEDIGAVSKLNDSAKTALMEARAWVRVGNLDAAMMLLKGATEKSAEDGSVARSNALAYLRAAFSPDNTDRMHVSALDALLANRDWLALNRLGHEALTGFARAARVYGLPNTALFLSSLNPEVSDSNLAFEAAVSALEAGAYDEAIRTAAPYAGESRFREIIAKVDLADRRYHEAMIAAAAIEDAEASLRIGADAAWLGKSWKNAAASYQAMDPNEFDEELAKRFAFSAYMAKEEALPTVVSTVLTNRNPVLLEGLESIFTLQPEGSALDRSRASVDTATKEIRMIEEMLQNG